jgi:HEAT repeats
MDARRRRIALTVLVAIFITAGLLALLFVNREPVYRGKKLSVWLENYYKDPGIGDYGQADQAVCELGTKGLPTLLDMVAARDSRFKIELEKWLKKLGAKNFRFVRANTLHIRAVHAFRALRERGRPAIPELAKLLEKPDTADCAAKCLAVIGDEAVPLISAAATSPDSRVRMGAADGTRHLSESGKRAIVPHLLPLLRDPSYDVQSTAAWALGSNGKEPGVVVPALLGLLNDTNNTLRCNAIAGLGTFGRDAISAVPQLQKLTNDPDSSVRTYAADALKRVQRW